MLRFEKANLCLKFHTEKDIWRHHLVAHLDVMSLRGSLRSKLAPLLGMLACARHLVTARRAGNKTNKRLGHCNEVLRYQTKGLHSIAVFVGSRAKSVFELKITKSEDVFPVFSQKTRMIYE